MIGRVLRSAVAALPALWLGCAPPANDFLVVHHRANGCDPGAPENSISALRCVAAGCLDGSAPCGVEGDARVLRVRGGSLGGDREIVWLHDASTARTAACAGDIELPGTAPIAHAELAACRLLRPDGSRSDESIPTLDEAIGALGAAPVTLFVELKGSGDPALDGALVEGVVAKLGGLRDATVFAGFDRAMLARARAAAPDVETACFAPAGSKLEQGLTVIGGELIGDVDACLEDGPDQVFVPPNFLDATIASHARHAGALLGTYGADTRDAYDAVRAWDHRLDVVFADHPAMYR